MAENSAQSFVCSNKLPDLRADPANRPTERRPTHSASARHGRKPTLALVLVRVGRVVARRRLVRTERADLSQLRIVVCALNASRASEYGVSVPSRPAPFARFEHRAGWPSYSHRPASTEPFETHSPAGSRLREKPRSLDKHVGGSASRRLE